MIHLKDGLYLVSCKNDKNYSDNKLELTQIYSYIFTYNDLKITLRSSFDVIYYTRYFYLPVIHSNYSVDIERWNSKELKYQYIQNYDNKDRLSIKKYIASKKVLDIMQQFVFHRVKKYLKKYQPPILIRGPYSHEHSFEQYWIPDEVIENTVYRKTVLSYENIPALDTKKHDDSDSIFWIYTFDDMSYTEVLVNYCISNDSMTLEQQAIRLLKEQSDLMFISFLQRNLNRGYNSTVELYRNLLKEGKITKEVVI